MSNNKKQILPKVNVSPQAFFDEENHSQENAKQFIKSSHPEYSSNNKNQLNEETDWNIHLAVALITLVILVNVTLAMVFGANNGSKAQDTAQKTPNIETNETISSNINIQHYMSVENKEKPSPTKAQNYIIVNQEALDILKQQQQVTSSSPSLTFPPVEAATFAIKGKETTGITQYSATPKRLSSQEKQLILNQLSRSPHITKQNDYENAISYYEDE